MGPARAHGPVPSRWRVRLALLVPPPAGDLGRFPHRAGIQLPRAHGVVAPRGRIGYAETVRSPAGDFARFPHCAGMGEACAHGLESPRRGVGLTSTVIPPAVNLARLPDRARVASARAHGPVAPGRRFRLAGTVRPPADNLPRGSHRAGVVVARAHPHCPIHTLYFGGFRCDHRPVVVSIPRNRHQHDCHHGQGHEHQPRPREWGACRGERQRRRKQYSNACPDSLPLRAPGRKLVPVVQVELPEHVRDVVLDGVRADTEAHGDLCVRATRAQLPEHPPLGRGEDVGVAWPPPAVALHAPILAR